MYLSHETINDNHLTQFYFSVVDAANFQVPAHWHNHMEILCLTEGSMMAHINESSYTLAPNDILIINPKDIHYTHSHDNCRYYLLQIPSLHLERISLDWRLIHFFEYLPHSAVNGSLNCELTAIFEEFYRIDSKKEKGYQLLCLVLLYRLLHLLYTKNSSILSTQSKSRTERDLLRIEQSMQYVRKNYQKNLSLAEAASLLTVTPEYFCRLFKKYTGQTFFTYIAQIRLMHFYQDLLQTDESITFLMEKNGITNYKQLMHMFKEAYGTTPHKLRMENKVKGCHNGQPSS